MSSLSLYVILVSYLSNPSYQRTYEIFKRKIPVAKIIALVCKCKKVFACRYVHQSVHIALPTDLLYYMHALER